MKVFVIHGCDGDESVAAGNGVTTTAGATRTVTVAADTSVLASKTWVGNNAGTVTGTGTSGKVANIDSIWSTEELAKKRCNFLGEDYRDISCIEIDNPTIAISDFAAWRAHLFLPTEEISVSQLGISGQLEFDKLIFSNELLPKVEHPSGGVFVRPFIRGYSYLTKWVKADIYAGDKDEAKEKFKELTADLGYCMTKEDVEKHILDWLQSPKRFRDSDVFDAGYFVIP